MTPHEFLKYTPATNCGECGYPACLAFAVAVTKGGVSPDLCPHLQGDLPADIAPKKDDAGLAAVDRGQDERDMALVAHLKSKVRDLDFQALAARIGADWSADAPDVLRFVYLGRPAVLGRDDVSLDGQDLVDPRDQILLYNYVAFGGGRKPDNTWVGMESLPNSISKIRTLATYCELRLAKRFSGRADRLQALCEQIGAKPGPGDQSADVGMIIPVLPRVPHYLLFWDEEPDDGFEAKVKVLFDHNVMDFLDLESIVFAAERLADRLAELDT
jgi:hypothetical protein